MFEPWRDMRAWPAHRFPRDKQQACREREINNIMEFEAVEESTWEQGGKVLELTWVEEWRGDEVRSRLCVRDYATTKRTDLFSPTPDSFFSRLQLRRLSCARPRAALLVDITTAFMHAKTDELVKVRVPPGIRSKTGYWKCLKALNGL